MHDTFLDAYLSLIQDDDDYRERRGEETSLDSHYSVWWMSSIGSKYLRTHVGRVCQWNCPWTSCLSYFFATGLYQYVISNIKIKIQDITKYHASETVIRPSAITFGIIQTSAIGSKRFKRVNCSAKCDPMVVPMLPTRRKCEYTMCV